MKVIKYSSLIILFSILICGCYSTTGVGSLGSNRDGMPSEPGKCYAKCLIPNQYETIIEEHPVYTGDITSEDVEVEPIKIVTKPSSSKWEKRKADRNCLSDDPNDCMVWCLITTPEETMILNVVQDTAVTKNYEWVEIEREVLVAEGGTTDWREVVCDSDITPKLYSKVQSALIDRGYSIGISVADGKIEKATKDALIKFQRDHGLPVGQLDMETLDELGIHI